MLQRVVDEHIEDLAQCSIGDRGMRDVSVRDDAKWTTRDRETTVPVVIERSEYCRQIGSR